MRYKVGDKVRVRGDLKDGNRYGNVKFIPGMKKGTIHIIEYVTERGTYFLDDSFYYSSGMLRPAKFKIWCETEAEKQAVLEELEKEGYVWVNGGEKPTEWNKIKNAPMGLIVKRGELYQEINDGIHNRDDMPKISPSEFTGLDFSKKIIITKTQTGATATYGDKTVTKEGEFEDASRQALAEVLCPFQVGDEVKLKRNGVMGEVIDISGETRVKFYTKEDIYDEWCLLSELKTYTEPLYNAKLFCIEGHGVFKQGVVYTVENGIFIGVHDSHFKDLEDVNKNLASQFMEIKGGLDE